MSLKKFGRSDIIRNAMRAYPHNSFLIYSSSVYFNQKPIESGSFGSDILSASGGISLFEYNVDRSGFTEITDSIDLATGEVTETITTSSRDDGYSYGSNPSIIPYTQGRGLPSLNYLKASPRSRNIQIVESAGGLTEIVSSGPMQEVSDHITNGGFVFTGSSYPMSASIVRELMSPAGEKTNYLDDGGIVTDNNNKVQSFPSYRHYHSLRNSLNFYSTRSPHYKVEFSASNIGSWNKDEQDINLISIPKIFYGSRIKPGSVSMKFYITGTLVGELKDEKYNGELIQVGPYGSTGSGSVAGVAMYEEGFALLTGSWKLTDEAFDFAGNGGDPRIDFITGSWLYFAAGGNDGISGSTVAAATTSASFDFSFKGHTETQVLTMYAHARRGEVNFSNNPTFLDYESAQNKILLTSSNVYQEKDSITIKNTVSSSYAGHSASFERQVYVSRVAIYDDDKKLIGVATLSNPVLKKEAQDLSFKLKLDI